MRLSRQTSNLEEFRVRGEQAEDCQSWSGIATSTDTVVVPELGKRLSRDDLWKASDPPSGSSSRRMSPMRRRPELAHGDPLK
jgi:hypothetical protein